MGNGRNTKYKNKEFKKKHKKALKKALKRTHKRQKLQKLQKQQHGGSPNNSQNSKKKGWWSRISRKRNDKRKSYNNVNRTPSAPKRFSSTARLKKWVKHKFNWPPEKIVASNANNNIPLKQSGPPKIDETIETSNVLGTGQFGEVKTAHSKCSPVFYDASLLLASKSLTVDASLEDTKQFFEEATILWTLQPHPHIVKMFGYQELKNGTKRIITELCNLGGLNHWLTKGTYSTEDLYNICQNIASGMEHIHSKGIVHRDLATRNVLLVNHNGNLIAKVSDFGLSVVMDEEDDKGKKIYKEDSNSQLPLPLRWLHPVTLETYTFNEASDVWSYGITLIEIFTEAQIPYYKWSNTLVMERVKSGYIIPRPSKCPIMLYDNVILKCLNADMNSSIRFKEIVQILSKDKNPLGDYLNTMNTGNTTNNRQQNRRNNASGNEKKNEKPKFYSQSIGYELSKQIRNNKPHNGQYLTVQNPNPIYEVKTQPGNQSPPPNSPIYQPINQGSTPIVNVSVNDNQTGKNAKKSLNRPNNNRLNNRTRITQKSKKANNRVFNAVE